MRTQYRGIAQLVEYRSPKPWVAGSNPPAPDTTKAIRESGWLFSTMCSACAERDVPLGRDVCFASDVRFAREKADTSHHFAPKAQYITMAKP